MSSEPTLSQDSQESQGSTETGGNVTWGRTSSKALLAELAGPTMLEADDEENIVGTEGDAWDPEVNGSSQPIPEEVEYDQRPVSTQELEDDKVDARVAAAYALIDAVCGPPPLPSNKRMQDYGRGKKRTARPHNPVVHTFRLLSPNEAKALNAIDTVETKAKEKLRIWLETKTEVFGYCKLSTMATNKDKSTVPLEERYGYVEWTFNGGQKVFISYGECASVQGLLSCYSASLVTDWRALLALCQPQFLVFMLAIDAATVFVSTNGIWCGSPGPITKLVKGVSCGSNVRSNTIVKAKWCLSVRIIPYAFERSQVGLKINILIAFVSIDDILSIAVHSSFGR
jgi:hypothetical protein